MMERATDRPSRLVGGVVAATLVLLLCLPATSLAMKNLSSDVGDADPCAQAGVGDAGGTVTKHNTGGTGSPTPVNVMLQCSPILVSPAGILLADDLVARDHGELSYYKPFFQGGHYATPSAFPQWLNTDGQPFVHGDIAEALRLQNFQASKAIVDALIGAAGGFGGALATSVIVCAVGGLPTLGIACAAAGAAVGGAAVAAVAGAIGAVVKDFLTAQYNRYRAMADADWFVWSDTKVFWNSFGDITDKTINPSLLDPNINPLHTDHVRIGVQWSNVPLGGGPEFFSATEGGSARASTVGASAAAPEFARQTATLNFNVGRDGRSANGLHRIRTGTRGHDRLAGARGDDVLQGLGGNDHLRGGPGDDILNGGNGHDVLSGGPGRDLLFGGRGNDAISGGSGHDILVGGPGRDTLDGGPGPDWIVDTSGPTLVRTGTSAGRGGDFVNVRDGRGDDTVICRSRRSTVVADVRDRVLGRCGEVIRRGRPLRLPG